MGGTTFSLRHTLIRVAAAGVFGWSLTSLSIALAANITCPPVSGVQWCYGTTSADSIQGSYSANGDFIDAKAGVDHVWGNDGPDAIYGKGDGDRTVDLTIGLGGGHGDDVVLGGTGSDLIWGERGDDELYGEDGDDVLHGGDGTNTLDGQAGYDVCYTHTGTINFVDHCELQYTE